MAAGIDIRNADRLVAIDGGTGAELGVLGTSGDPTLPFLGAQIVNPATNNPADNSIWIASLVQTSVIASDAAGV